MIAYQEGRIAVMRRGGVLSLPVSDGSGEEVCRALMRACFGSSDGQVRLLGSIGGVGGRDRQLEVWLARRLPRGLACVDGAALEWWPLDDVVARVGSPALRDPNTLGALTLAARTDFLPEWPSASPGPGTAEGGGDTNTPRQAISRALVLGPGDEARAELRQPALRLSSLNPKRRVPEHFLNTELSLIEFNGRVLALAEDERVPLLERLRFIAIVSKNLDEFFMVRVAGLKRAIAEGRPDPSADGLTPQEQFDAIVIQLQPLLVRQDRCLHRVLAALAAHGIHLSPWDELTEKHRADAREHFHENVLPLLTGLAVSGVPDHPFPHFPNLSLSLLVSLQDRSGRSAHSAAVILPASVPRLLPLAGGRTFVPLEDVIRAHAGAVFPGQRVQAAYAFRVTRSGEFEVDEAGAGSLLHAIDDEVRRRHHGPVVRVEVEAAMPQAARNLLLREFRFEDSSHVSALGWADLYETAGLLDLGAVTQIAELPEPRHRFPAFTPACPIGADRSIFSVLAERDVLVHHPYDSFPDSVQRFVCEVADDPEVQAIKMILYRTEGQSEIVAALKRAAASGKGVLVVVELKARFDEERNIGWARELERAGIHVTYGLVGLKVHAKIALVVRREGDRVRRYVHIGTGNYHAVTARLYTDLGLLSSDETLGAEVHDLFNELSGASEPPRRRYRRLLVAPTRMLTAFRKLIDREAAHARAARGGHIRVKCNGLTDPAIIEALYRAAQAGVRIELIVRSVCTLRPGVRGLSDNVRVISLLGRFLEHARIFYFANAGQPEYYIGSADWRPRNLRRRVEVAAPVLDPAARGWLDLILETELADPTAWELAADGSYTRRGPLDMEPAGSAQECFLEPVEPRAAGTPCAEPAVSRGR